MVFCVFRPADTAKDICHNFWKEDIRDLLWDTGIGEANRSSCDFVHQASDNRKLSSASDRRYTHVRDRGKPPVQVGPELHCYRVR